MIPVKGHSNLYRDEKSGAIISCDGTSYNQYISAKKLHENQKYQIQQLKNDVEELKTLLKEFINGTK
jgi:hypothetical protein